METVLCSNCSYPIGVNSVGESIKCPYCGVSGTVIDQTEVQMRGKAGSQTQVQTKIGGTGALDFFLGLLIGIVFGPAIKDAAEKGVRRIP